MEAETEAVTQTETEAETTPLEALKVKDYGGYEFRVLTQFSNYAITAFDFDDTTGELLNDTIYDRNRYVEEKLNITINNIKGPDYDYGYSAKQLRQMVSAGDDLYDLMSDELRGIVPFSQDGSLVDLYSIPDLDMTNPWWEKNAIRYYDIDGSLYFTHSPMHLHYYESLTVPVFNKKVAEDYQIEDLYTAVHEGRWTLDMFATLSNTVTDDVNGDGKMNAQDDVFGVSLSNILLTYFVIGADCRYTDMGADGRMVFNGVTERWVSITEKLQSYFGTKGNYIDDGTPGASTFTNGYIGAFEADRALFFVDVLGQIKDLRDMDADFGILPLPKYDETQAEYISTFYVGAAGLYVPVTNQMYTEIGPILEHLGAYSYMHLIPAYYETSIKAKQMRDEESLVILEMMLSNISFDLGITFKIGGIDSDYPGIVMNNKNLASHFAAKTEMIDKNLADIYAAYANIQ